MGDIKFPRRILKTKGLVPDVRIVNALVVNKKGEILLLERPRDNHYFPSHFGILSGKIEDGEEPEITLKRESLEELGVDLSVYTVVKCKALRYLFGEEKVWETTEFLVFLEVEDLNIELNRENESFCWRDPSNLSDLPLTPEVPDMVENLQKWYNT